MKKRIIAILVCSVLALNVLMSGGFAISQKTQLEYIDADEGTLVTLKGAGVYPSRYSSAELGYTSKVDDQGSANVCWAFTQNEVIETYVAKTTGEKVDLSEQTMKFETSDEYNTLYGHDRGANDGGNEHMSMAYLTRGGTTLEADEPFSESDERSIIPSRLKYRGVLTSQPILVFDESSQALALSHIKKLVYENGAVGSSVCYMPSTSYEDAKRIAYYYNGPEASPNHSVTIVGWDDNYSRNNFVQKPAGDGAFIVKNSWGRYHNGGTTDLVYVSYYDKFIWQEVFSSTFEMQNDIYDNIYQYDHQGYTGKYWFDGDSDIMYATKYKKSSPGESVSAVSVYVTDPDTKIEVYVNSRDGSADEKYKFTKTCEKTFEYAGYYLMEFSPVEITGDEFCVAIRVINSSGACFPVRENLGNFVKNATQKKDTCFVSYDGFANMTALEDFGNVSFTMRKTMLVMKAFTKNTSFSLRDSSLIFEDVSKDAWYKPDVDFAITYNIFNGTSDKTFSPEGNLTRAQFVKLLANITGLDTSDNDMKSYFLDVDSGMWYTSAVQWAYENGIVSGTGYRIFSPDEKITREQMCVMLVNYCENYLGKTMIKSNQRFADHNLIGGWAVEGVYKCKYAELISGVGDNCFAPQNTATRGQGARVLSGFYKKYILM